MLQPTSCSSVSFLCVCSFVYLFRIVHYSSTKVFCIYLALINRGDGKRMYQPTNRPSQTMRKVYIKRNGHSAEIISSILLLGYVLCYLRNEHLQTQTVIFFCCRLRLASLLQLLLHFLLFFRIFCFFFVCASLSKEIFQLVNGFVDISFSINQKFHK